jgi:hypothetical protein
LKFTEKRVKGQDDFIGYHLNMYHIVTLRIIMEECCNNKTILLYCFIDLNKSFDTIPGTNPWNRLKEIKVPYELRVVIVSVITQIVLWTNTNPKTKCVTQLGTTITVTSIDVPLVLVKDKSNTREAFGVTLGGL